MQVVRHQQKAMMPPFIKFFVTLAALAAVSFAVAFVWQNKEDSLATVTAEKQASSYEPGAVSLIEGSVAEPLEEAVESALESRAESRADGEEASGGESGDKEPADGEEGLAVLPGKQSYSRDAAAGSVPENENMVKYSYFDDAIFFGDSISTGIPLYMKTLVPEAAVVAIQGVSTVTAHTSLCIDVGGVKMTMLDAAKTKGERKKVYIMLGSNGIDYDEKSFIDGYREFLSAVKEQYPEAVIYLQSMLPVTANVNKVYPNANINNTRISQYNAAISKLAGEAGVYYLDVARCMVDSSGFLPTEASPFDGMHLTPEYYIKWFDYLRSHTVEPKKITN